MNISENRKELFKAISAAQGEFTTVEKNAKNPHFNSKFAPLDSIIEMIRPILPKHGLSVMQHCDIPESGSGIIVETIIAHDSGQYISSRLYMPVTKNDPQGHGSAITYGRRYSLAAALGIVSDEDVDGNQTEQPNRAKASSAPSRENGSQPKIELSKAQTELLNTLVDYCQGNEQRMAEVLKECSHYDKDGKTGEMSLKDVKKPNDNAPFQRWMGATLGKLRDRIKAEEKEIPL